MMYIYGYNSDGIYTYKAYVDDDHTPVDGDNFLLSPPEDDCAFGKFIVSGGKFVPYIPEKTDSEKLSEFLKSVSTTIDYVGSIGLQCYMAGIDFPADWKEYRTELIALSKTTEYSDSLSLPTQPPLPTDI